MRCTNNLFRKIKLLCIICIADIFVITACGKNVELTDAYEKYSSDYTASGSNYSYFSQDLCVSDSVNFGQEKIEHDSVAEAAGVFNLDQNEVTYNQNIYKTMFPASTTKILTAYIIIANSNLDETVTISANAANPGQSSSVCGICEGDRITVRDLLYGLMLSSGNDAAIALAEYYSGSVEAFAEVMNDTARKLGATNSYFVNPHGLPDENHYTSIYDMYLFTNAAVKLDEFCTIFSSESHNAVYSSATGETIEKTWNNTCQYISGAKEVPEGYTIIGAKTGTTNAAGYCLVVYSQNSVGEKLISIVFKADGKSDLYLMMDEILTSSGK